MREQFSKYKSLKCTLAGPPEYDRFDCQAEPAAAQIKFGMKQEHRDENRAARRKRQETDRRPSMPCREWSNR